MIESLVFTGILLIIAVFAVRYLASQLGGYADDRPSFRPDVPRPLKVDRQTSLSESMTGDTNPEETIEAPGDPLPDVSSSPEWQPPRRHPASSLLSTCLTMGALAALVFGWASFGSFDAAFQRAFPGKSLPQTSVAMAQGNDWKDVDGIRWFFLVGTDSAGVGYKGWVPELAFKEVPPDPTPGGKTLLEKIGLPSAAEQAKAAKQLKKMSEELKRQNQRTTGREND